MDVFKNSQGKVWYGIHMYPGVAEYRDKNEKPYRVLVLENAIRAMDPTFQARPVFVHHVDDVEQDIDALRGEADGWVVESFYNAADGNHWVKFITVTEKAEEAITKKGWRLSNCYVPKGPMGGKGLWNGVTYEKEIKDGEYEHLAIVPNPRYEQSVILTPEQFKKYNADKALECERIANSKKEKPQMKLKLFKKAKVENELDLAELCVQLNSGRELSIEQMVNELNAVDDKMKKPQLANLNDMVEYGGESMSLNALLEKHKAACNELAELKAAKANIDSPDEDGDSSDDGEAGIELTNVDDDKEAKEKAEDLVEHEEAEMEEKAQNEEDDEKKDDKKADKKEDKKSNASSKPAPTKDELEARRKAKEKADKLRNAHNQASEEPAPLNLSDDRVARGKSRYGSN